MQATSLPRERVRDFQHEAQRYMSAQGAGDSRAAANHGTTHAVDSLGSGVRNMSVMEQNSANATSTGGYPPPMPQNQGGPMPMSGVQPSHAQNSNQNLMRSNSFQ